MPDRTSAHGRRSGAVALLLATALWVLAGIAGAAESRVVIEDGAEAVDRDALIAEVERAEAEGIRLSVSVLADEPPGGATAEADRVVDQAGGAALVISPEEVGGVSDDPGHDAAGAVDAALDELADDDDLVAATAAFTDHLLRGGSGGLPGSGGDIEVDVPGIGPVSTTLTVIAIVGIFLLVMVFSVIGRIFGAGRRRRRGRRGVGGAVGGAAVGYGVGRRRNNRGGVGRSFGGTPASASRSRGSTSRKRSSGSRSRGGGSRGGRSRGGGGRSRGGGRR